MDPTQTSITSAQLLRDMSMPYRERLALRPWETPLALERLRVPQRLLPGSCPVITKWVALTGTTCAGKSTLISTLEKLGYTVVHEIARGYIVSECQKGRSVTDIRSDDRAFRQRVFKLTLEAEMDLLPRSHELIFFDRSAIDCLSFHRGSGYDPHEILNQLQPYRFDQIFHCNRLPFEDDGLRTVNDERRLFLDAALERDYRALGYRPVRIPCVSLEDRVKLILNRCH